MLKANTGKVIVRQLEKPNVSPGGIVLPDDVGKKTNSGFVVDSCNEFSDEYFLPAGTRVHFKLYAGYEVEYDGEKLCVISLEDVLAFESVSGEQPDL